MTDAIVLTRPPALAPLLLRGALLSPTKRPRPDAPFPRTRLVQPSVRADAGRLGAYRRICGFEDDGTLPVTYPHVLGFAATMRLMSGRAFPLPVLGLVHTSIGITRHGAMPADRPYEIAVEVEGLAPHRRGTEATVLTRARDAGELVWESRSTYLARHRVPPGAAGSDGGERRAEPDGTEQRAEPEGTEQRARERAEPEELPATAEWRLPGDLGRRYGAASGDRNPIHLSAATARLFGFPRAIAHGMWTVARCLAAYGVPEGAVVGARFKAPVLLPATVHYAEAGPRFQLRSSGHLHVEGDVAPS
ncbi:MaoC/PaaZ C-terminal domain-containing protein [Streptomyces sp. NPDC047130]|uniref:MaoC/PaaZ C-terminal domain-containing protein n=1 Tax=Streptomyces sp. NPDC047130 TaxID=3155261 RepID=UPI00340FE2D0